jgi:hypothetical protein
MSDQDPNRYSFQGDYAWGEPMRGSIIEWKSDPLRFYKMVPFPLVIFGVAAACRLEMSLKVVGWLSVVSVFFMGCILLGSLFPRTIRLFKDKISIVRPSGRSNSSRDIDFTEIEEMETRADGSNERIILKLKSGKIETLICPEQEGVDRLKSLLKNARNA